ncbi:uncharacterized protein LOC142177046 [Nicotiana tabacum]|uniref:Uncharacterized protein LOC142177046 n=1 Tax=Nicotiana tabacum TaxID=4097 RepID=A0AC58TWJ3_TOBAC
MSASIGKNAGESETVDCEVFEICREITIDKEWDTNASKKALVAWDKLCRPKSTGGPNITDMSVWNKAALLKHLWNICKKKDKLWIQWVHAYYIKGRVPWTVKAKQASWIVHKILHAVKYLDEAGLEKAKVLTTRTYTIRTIYNQLRGEFPKASWRRLIYNNKGCPKWIFIFYLALQERLYTKDRFSKWGIQVNQTCPLCDHEMEDHQHLFFTCKYSTDIWGKLLAWQGIARQVYGWEEEVEWATKHVTGKGSKAEVYRISMAGAVYHLWIERNRGIFQQERRSSGDITRQVIQEVHCRGYMQIRMRKEMQYLKFYSYNE